MSVRLSRGPLHVQTTESYHSRGLLHINELSGPLESRDAPDPESPRSPAPARCATPSPSTSSRAAGGAAPAAVLGPLWARLMARPRTGDRGREPSSPHTRHLVGNRIRFGNCIHQRRPLNDVFSTARRSPRCFGSCSEEHQSKSSSTCLLRKTNPLKKAPPSGCRCNCNGLKSRY
jgi:hypothetical protein